MTIPFTTNPGGLFTRIGALGHVLRDLYVLNLTTLPTDATNISNQYEGTGPANPEPDLLNTLFTTIDSSRFGANASTGQLTQIAIATVERMVFRDKPQASRTSIGVNLAEVIRQMKGAGQTVKACTIGMSTATIPGITNNGNGFLVLSTKRGDGLVQENTIAETALLVCTSDAQTGGLSAGNEQWQFRGDEAQTNPFHWEWPLGSGAVTSISCVDPTKSNAAGNLLTNGGFDTFTTNTPNNWSIAAGTAGTEIFAESSVVYSGAKALRFAGGTGVNTSITQQFNLTTGTSAKVLAETPYAHLMMLKCDVVPASGVLTIDLIDNTGATISDDQGLANSYVVNLNSLSTTYAPQSSSFRLPRVLPASVRLRYRLTTPIPAGSNLYIDHTSLAPMVKLYPGGPFLSIFAGSTPWIAGDSFNLTTTNDRGGSTQLNTFQTLFDRFFNMRVQELLLPSSSAPTISDGLI